MIPSKLYKKIVESVPILCVDVILVYKSSFILVKRINEPLKGQWWLVGGRALKGEKTKDAVKRKVKEELNLIPRDIQFGGVYEDSYKRSAWGTPTSSVSVVYLANINSIRNLKLDKTSSHYCLSDRLPSRFLKHYVES